MKSLNHLSRRYVSLLCAIALMATSLAHAFAQQPATAKHAITHKDYDTWHSIQSPQISRDGKFVAYAYMAQDEDSEIVARNLATGQEWRAPRGYRPPAPPPDDSIPNFGELIAAQGRLARPAITADTKFVVFTIEPMKADLNKAKKDKKKPDDMPKNGLGIMDLSSGQVAKIDRVKNFQLPEDGGGFIAYLMETKPATPPARESAPKENPTNPTESVEDSSDSSQAPQTGRPGRGPKKEYGSDLILRNTTTGTERTFSEVLDYSLSKDAKTLVYTVSSKNEETNGIYLASTQSDAAPIALLSGKGKYQKLTWDEEQSELAFISDRDDQVSKQSKFKVYMWERASGAPIAGNGDSPTIREGAKNHATALLAPIATEIVSTSSPGFRKDFVVSDKANLSFSLDGSRLFLGASPPPEPEKNPDDDTPADEKVLVDLWHWKDDYIQPIQKVRAEQERQRSYRAAYDVQGKRFVQLRDQN